MLKFPRNALCWCGSGIKYKYCHLRRDKEDPLTIDQVLSRKKRIQGKKYCLHPLNEQCEGKIISAHTIQKKGKSLKLIARDGHVYTFSKDFTRIMKTRTLDAVLVGVNKASTFTGFCAFHDNKTFEPIEKHLITPTPEQVFLLGYRVLCHELYLKRIALEHSKSIKQTLDRGRPIDQQVEIQRTMTLDSLGIETTINELELAKFVHDDILLSQTYSQVNYYAIRLGTIPDVVCSGMPQPTFDFRGKKLQELSRIDVVLDYLAFSIIAQDIGGMIVYGWIGENKSAERLIASLRHMTLENQIHASVRFAFESIENLFMSPDWWEGLDINAQDRLRVRQLSDIHPDFPQQSDCLLDDGLRLVSWYPLAIETNIPER